MAVAITDEQTQITDAVTAFATRHAPIDWTREHTAELTAGMRPGWWADLVDQGWPAVHVRDEFGGQGGALADAASVLDAAGYTLLPGPLLPTLIAAAVAAAGEPGSAAAGLQRDIAAGATAVVLLPEAGQLRAAAAGSGWTLDGYGGPEIGLCGADRIVVGARTDDDELLWIVLDGTASGVEIIQQDGTDATRAVGSLRVTSHPVRGAEVLGGLDGDRVRCTAVGLMTAEAAGIARWCVDNVVSYLKVREQFGRPIGSFQAMQHKAALLFIDSELAASAAWDAVRAATQSSEQQRVATAAAAITALGRLPELVVDALTMFGAIGFTWEHDLHLYWKRAISLAAAAGPAAEWTRRLGEPGGPARDFAIDLADAEPGFRLRVAAALDRAAELHNDTAGRQNPDHPEYCTGGQRTALAGAGLVAPHLAVPWGLAATPVQQLVIDEEFEKRPYLVRPSLGIAEWILPTILTGGSPAQARRFAGPTLRGEIAWCQLFSEPGAGSDLASLCTRATPAEGGWRINGQKVWTSSAQRSDWGALLARTDPDVPKHKGIGYFLVDMASPGITIRPLRTAGGEAHFNEVFFDDVFVPGDLLVGEAGAGWSHALATMADERVAIGAYIKMDRERVLRALAGQAGVDQDAVVHALGEVRAGSNAVAALGVRDTLRRLSGHHPGPASSLGKVATALMVRKVTAHALELAGRSALLGGDPAVEQSLLMPAEVIGGGTVEIQLNIIATMILGLPRR